MGKRSKPRSTKPRNSSHGKSKNHSAGPKDSIPNEAAGSGDELRHSSQRSSPGEEDCTPDLRCEDAGERDGVADGDANSDSREHGVSNPEEPHPDLESQKVVVLPEVPPPNGSESRERSEEMLGFEFDCPHLPLNVSASNFSKKLKKCDITKCKICVPRQPKKKPNKIQKSNQTRETSLWICLHCANVGCGQFSDSKQPIVGLHSKQHFGQMSGHALAMELHTRICWCFSCGQSILNFREFMIRSNSMPRPLNHDDSGDTEDRIDSEFFEKDHGSKTKGKRKESAREAANGEKTKEDFLNLCLLCSQYIQDQFKEVQPQEERAESEKKETKVETEHVVNEKVVNENSATKEELPIQKYGSRRIVGLQNLGNTCFFNSVLQNLSAIDLLRRHFSSLSFQNLLHQSPLTTALMNFYLETNADEAVSSSSNSSHSNETQAPGKKAAETVSGFKSDLHQSSLSGKKGGRDKNFQSSRLAIHKRHEIYNPKKLFSAICSKAPRFKGYQQQDSHELLNYLLDGLISEEIKLKKEEESTKSSLLHSRSVHERKEEEIETGEGKEKNEKKNGKEEGIEDDRKPSESFINQVFGGKLSSTLICSKCYHKSTVYEPFLNISLSIPSKSSFKNRAKEVEKKNQRKGVKFQGKQSKNSNKYISEKQKSDTKSLKEKVDNLGTLNGPGLSPDTKSTNEFVLGDNKPDPSIHPEFNTSHDSLPKPSMDIDSSLQLEISTSLDSKTNLNGEINSSSESGVAVKHNPQTPLKQPSSDLALTIHHSVPELDSQARGHPVNSKTAEINIIPVSQSSEFSHSNSSITKNKFESDNLEKINDELNSHHENSANYQAEDESMFGLGDLFGIEEDGAYKDPESESPNTDHDCSSVNESPWLDSHVDDGFDDDSDGMKDTVEPMQTNESSEIKGKTNGNNVLEDEKYDQTEAELEAEKKLSLQSCFSFFIKNEILSGDNKLLCLNCTKIAQKQKKSNPRQKNESDFKISELASTESKVEREVKGKNIVECVSEELHQDDSTERNTNDILPATAADILENIVATQKNESIANEKEENVSDKDFIIPSEVESTDFNSLDRVNKKGVISIEIERKDVVNECVANELKQLEEVLLVSTMPNASCFKGKEENECIVDGYEKSRNEKGENFIDGDNLTKKRCDQLHMVGSERIEQDHVGNRKYNYMSNHSYEYANGVDHSFDYPMNGYLLSDRNGFTNDYSQERKATNESITSHVHVAEYHTLVNYADEKVVSQNHKDNAAEQSGNIYNMNEYSMHLTNDRRDGVKTGVNGVENQIDCGEKQFHNSSKKYSFLHGDHETNHISYGPDDTRKNGDIETKHDSCLNEISEIIKTEDECCIKYEAKKNRDDIVEAECRPDLVNDSSDADSCNNKDNQKLNVDRPISHNTNSKIVGEIQGIDCFNTETCEHENRNLKDNSKVCKNAVKPDEKFQKSQLSQNDDCEDDGGMEVAEGEKDFKNRIDREGSETHLEPIRSDATKQLLIFECPSILVIQINRFHQSFYGSLNKLNDHVVFSEFLDIKPFVDASNLKDKNYNYQLLGVVEHSGSIRGGHYVSYVRGIHQGDWYYISDSYVSDTNLNKVLSSQAYLLFYEKI